MNFWQFDNNEFEGIGKITYLLGGYYHGSFLNSKKHGEGLYIYRNGDRYSGYWLEG